MPKQMFQDFIALFVVIDPVFTAVTFASLTHDAPWAQRRTMATRGTVVAGLLMLIFAFLGEGLLRSLEISLAAFRISGGIFLFLIAVDMVLARHSGMRSTTDEEEREASLRSDVSVFPLAFPLLAGPGALTSIVLLMAKTGDSWVAKGSVVAVLLAVLSLTLLFLRASPRLLRIFGITGSNVVGRVLGIILGALAAQYVIDGLGESLFRASA